MELKKHEKRRDFVSRLKNIAPEGDNSPVKVELPKQKGTLEVYPASIRKLPKGGVFLAGVYNLRNALFILGPPSLRVMQEYDGRVISEHSDFVIKKCRWTRATADKVRKYFPYCAPNGKPEGKKSISFGDVLGVAGNAQIRAFSGKAELAFSRQCIYQIRRLELQPEDAIDAITWNVFREGFKKGYSAEACHLVTTGDLRVMIDAGYTRFSVEPADPVRFELRNETKKNLLEKVFEVPWIALRDKFELMLHRYKDRRIEFSSPDVSADDQADGLLTIVPSEKEVLSSICIFGSIIKQLVEMDQVLVSENIREKVFLEISFLRAETAITPFEHYFLVNELLRRDVYPDYIAPGNVTRDHWLVARNMGGVGLSALAGTMEEDSTDFPELRQHEVYPDISYMTALECMAEEDPDFFRTMWEMSRNYFEEARKGRKTEIDIHRIPGSKDLADNELSDLLKQDQVYEFLMLTMGFVLTERDDHGHRYIRQKLFDFLQLHDDIYTEALLKKYQKWAEDYVNSERQRSHSSHEV